MPQINEENEEDKFALLYPYALNEETGETIVPSAEHYINGSRTYDEKRDKGRLACPECRKAKLIHRDVMPMAGGRNINRDHFARHPKTSHKPSCEIGRRAANLKGSRDINEKLGAFFYINCDTPSKAYPHGGRPPRRAWISERAKKLFSDDIKKIEYAQNTFFPKRREITNPEFVRRQRIKKPATDIQSLLSNLRTLNETPEKNKDSWAIVSGVAFKISNMLLRYNPNLGTRDLSAETTAKLRTTHNLPNDFRFPEDKGYDKFARIFNQLAAGINHPVLLHFRVASRPQNVQTSCGNLKIYKFGEYYLERLNPIGVELPLESIGLCVVTENTAVASKLKIGQEFMALAHPRLKEYGKDKQYTAQDFVINRPEDLIPLDLQQFREAITPTELPKKKKRPKTSEREPA